MVLMELSAACELLGAAIAGTDPARLSGWDCSVVVELLARTEKRCAGLRVVAAARAGECGAHRERGFSSPAAWLADASGITTAEAKVALEVANSIEGCAATATALRGGDMSLAQAAEITKTEAAAPGSESTLLELAARKSMAALRDEARRLRLAARDPEELHRRQRQVRQGRHWCDDHAMIHLAGAFAPEVGVPIANRIDAEVDRIIRQARRDGQVPEPRERLVADAIAHLILHGPSGAARRAEVVLVCDIAAFQRGHAEAGELCHVIGGGPVPVSVVQEMATAAFIKGVLHDGVRIDTVAHYGRQIPARLRTALDLGEAPRFSGATCVDCQARYGLQWDHVDPVAHHGPTSLENLKPRCWPCHQEKTARDRQAGLLTPRPPSQPNQGDDPLAA